MRDSNPCLMTYVLAKANQDHKRYHEWVQELCYAVLYCAMLWNAMSCHAVMCYAVIRHGILSCAMASCAMFCCIVCCAMQCFAMHAPQLIVYCAASVELLQLLLACNRSCAVQVS